MPALEHGTDSDSDSAIIISTDGETDDDDTDSDSDSSEYSDSESSSMTSEQWQAVLESHPWYGCHPTIPLYYPRFWVYK